MRQNTTTNHIVPVLSSGRCCGHLLNRGPMGREAFDADDHSRGHYRTHQEAAAVLLEAVQVGGQSGRDAT